MKKKLIVFTLIVIAGIIRYKYVYKDHRNMLIETADFLINAAKITKEFSVNPATAKHIFLNKTIEISGAISEINTNGITLINGVICLLSDSINKPTEKTSKLKDVLLAIMIC